MTAQVTAHQTDTAKHELNPHLARQFLETIFSYNIKEAARPVYIEVRGKQQSDKDMTFSAGSTLTFTF